MLHYSQIRFYSFLNKNYFFTATKWYKIVAWPDHEYGIAEGMYIYFTEDDFVELLNWYSGQTRSNTMG